MEKVKSMRVGIQTILNSFQFVPECRETMLALMELELSRMFLGKALKASGAPNPYPTSRDASSTKVEPMADNSEHDFSEIEEFRALTTHVQKVKYFRAEMLKIEDQLKALNTVHCGIEQKEYQKEALNHLEISSMWLGMALPKFMPKEEVKEEKNNDTVDGPKEESTGKELKVEEPGTNGQV